MAKSKNSVIADHRTMTFVLITAMNFSFLRERKAILSERVIYPFVFEALKLRL
jgi:hypothetical protein